MTASLAELIAALHSSRGIAHKRDIGAVVAALGIGGDSTIKVGDDCAAIPDPSGDGWLLLAIEGFLTEFVEREPRFAGWCGVMVNVSDIYAMGGRPIAVVDAIWSRDALHGKVILDGMADAARVYGVPVVGGHANARAGSEQLSVAILGRARALLSSFEARPGDVLIAATDLRGGYRAHFSNWDAASGSDPERLRGDLDILPTLAEDRLCCAAKDISNAGLLGTLLMLLECSNVGAEIDLDQVPMPADADPARWLLHTFPSYGFLLAVRPSKVDEVLARFHARDLSASAIGRCTADRQLHLTDNGERALAWDFHQQPLTGCAPSLPPAARHRRAA
ncbi:MAG: sll0787 family AIR synthase-like protein [Xanthomonadaceae bacterium]|nr:sll0787 family AIR synthase-like protein [Xanthomonadaceae bacterium]